MKIESISNPWLLSSQKIEDILKTNLKNGLSQKEANRRLKIFGLNKLPDPQKFSVFKIFLNQFSSIFVVVLIIALIISAVLNQAEEAIAIGSIILINAFIGFIQEYKAEKSLKALMES